MSHIRNLANISRLSFKFQNIPSEQIIYFTILLLVFAAGCIQQVPQDKQISEKQPEQLQEQKTDYGKLNRSIYGLPDETFAQLPEFPDLKSFLNVKDRVEHQIHNNTGIPEAYYKQPEFYPTFLEHIELIKNPPAGRAALLGFGAYPAEQSFKARKGETITGTAFFHASWLVPLKQEINLAADYNERYFDVVLDKSFVLGPSYPNFDYNWTHKVNVKIKVNAPPGIYAIGIDVPGSIKVDRPYFRVNIEVIE